MKQVMFHVIIEIVQTIDNLNLKVTSLGIYPLDYLDAHCPGYSIDIYIYLYKPNNCIEVTLPLVNELAI